MRNRLQIIIIIIIKNASEINLSFLLSENQSLESDSNNHNGIVLKDLVFTNQSTQEGDGENCEATNEANEEIEYENVKHISSNQINLGDVQEPHNELQRDTIYINQASKESVHVNETNLEESGNHVHKGTRETISNAKIHDITNKNSEFSSENYDTMLESCPNVERNELIKLLDTKNKLEGQHNQVNNDHLNPNENSAVKVSIRHIGDEGRPMKRTISARAQGLKQFARGELNPREIGNERSYHRRKRFNRIKETNEGNHGSLDTHWVESHTNDVIIESRLTSSDTGIVEPSERSSVIHKTRNEATGAADGEMESGMTFVRISEVTPTELTPITSEVESCQTNCYVSSEKSNVRNVELESITHSENAQRARIHLTNVSNLPISDPSSTLNSVRETSNLTLDNKFVKSKMVESLSSLINSTPTAVYTTPTMSCSSVTVATLPSTASTDATTLPSAVDTTLSNMYHSLISDSTGTNINSPLRNNSTLPSAEISNQSYTTVTNGNSTLSTAEMSIPSDLELDFPPEIPWLESDLTQGMQVILRNETGELLGVFNDVADLRKVLDSLLGTKSMESDDQSAKLVETDDLSGERSGLVEGSEESLVVQYPSLVTEGQLNKVQLSPAVNKNQMKNQSNTNSPLRKLSLTSNNQSTSSTQFRVLSSIPCSQLNSTSAKRKLILTHRLASNSNAQKGSSGRFKSNSLPFSTRGVSSSLPTENNGVTSSSRKVSSALSSNSQETFASRSTNFEELSSSQSSNTQVIRTVLNDGTIITPRVCQPLTLRLKPKLQLRSTSKVGSTRETQETLQFRGEENTTSKSQEGISQGQTVLSQGQIGLSQGQVTLKTGSDTSSMLRSQQTSVRVSTFKSSTGAQEILKSQALPNNALVNHQESLETATLTSQGHESLGLESQEVKSIGQASVAEKMGSQELFFVETSKTQNPEVQNEELKISGQGTQELRIPGQETFRKLVGSLADRVFEMAEIPPINSTGVYR